jgi:hypothetical protein
MGLYIAIACFVLATLAFLFGFVTEYRQSRRFEPYALVPALPWAVTAAIFVAMGLWWLPYAIPCWVIPFAFVAATVVFGYAILRAAAP